MKIFFRLFKGTLWNLIVTLLGIGFYDYAPISGVWFWLAFVVFIAIEYVAISKLRERIRF